MSKARITMPAAILKVGTHLLREKLTGAKARIAADIPGSVDAVTPQWLTAILCGKVPGAEVLSFQKGRGSFGTHERRELILQYNEVGQASDLPRSVFTKSLPSVVTRMLVGFMGHARYEMLFYTRVRPELAIETPRCYHSASDKKSYAAIHVIENVDDHGKTRFCDEQTYVTRDMAENMVDLLADLHGPFFADSRLKTDFKWLVDYATWFRLGIEKVKTDHYSRKAINKASHVIPPRLFARRDEIWPATMRGLEAHEDGPTTILHSDVHIGNWYHLANGRMGLLDWQCISQGLWARDVSYALSTALTVEDRRAWEKSLVDRYVQRMGDKWKVDLAFDHSFVLYRQQLFHALMMWTQTLCHSPFQPTSQKVEMILELIRRIATAIDDNDSLDSFPASPRHG